MENTFLPGTVRERLADLMKYHKVSQTDLALKIGCGDSLLSRFLTGKTDKIGDENIIRIARVFNVSTDFLLGVTNVPDRKTMRLTNWACPHKLQEISTPERSIHRWSTVYWKVPALQS